MNNCIVREAFIDGVAKRYCAPCKEHGYDLDGDWCRDCVITYVLKMVRDAPAADVEPVRHGRWERCFEDWRQQIEGDKCSACGFEYYGTGISRFHYCPNCGAKMEGGADV